MSIFNFQLGLFNAWIPILFVFLISWFLPLIDKKSHTRLTSISWCSNKERNIVWLGALLMFIIFIVGIWKPFYINSVFFKIGITVYLLGIFSLIVSYFNYIASAGNKKQVVGFYKISRNPIFLFTTISLIGVSIATVSPILIILTLFHFQLSIQIIFAQEKHFKKIYGTAYKKYIKQVRRFL